ncbi:alkaline phosphatase D family protein [Blastopirellula marina]|uniref:Alkaline phosphatase n=1 Tax=Blastopirellula marina TaxID=124 RepID=A0A2S8GUN0_9BACT|nr:alkaline phosphatase D family protein [Blastopirellula marina]PQO48120.1 alkaline phosphatase [Blastopirellula marina]
MFRSAANTFLANRRQFVLGAGSLALLPWFDQCLEGAAKRNASFSQDPFTLGVASGDPAPDGFVLWTRLAPDPIDGGGMPAEIYELTWELSEDESFQEIAKRGKAFATPQLGHSVHVEVHGLPADKWYFYRFQCGDAISPVGKARTTPGYNAAAEKLRFAFASCQHYETGYYTAFEHMAQEDLDLVLHLGDYIYEYGPNAKRIRQHNSPEIQSLDDYRNRYALYRSDPALQAAHAACPWLVVWDDHEFDNNYASDISEEKGIDHEAFLLRRANAYQAYYEMMPLRRRCLPKGPDMQLYRRIPYGQLANFEMLDTRQYRTDQPNGDKKSPYNEEAANPKNTLLGDKQEHWLMRDLIASQSNWNILGQQVMMAQVDLEQGDGEKYSMDQWPGAGHSRDRLLSFMRDRKVPNPVVLTGDIHKNWVNDLKVDFTNETEAPMGTEFVATSISSGGNGGKMEKEEELLKSENPFVKFFNGERGYVSCTVTPDEWRSDYQVVEYVDKPGAPLVTRASFVVESGKPGAIRA